MPDKDPFGIETATPVVPVSKDPFGIENSAAPIKPIVPVKPTDGNNSTTGDALQKRQTNIISTLRTSTGPHEVKPLYIPGVSKPDAERFAEYVQPALEKADFKVETPKETADKIASMSMTDLYALHQKESFIPGITNVGQIAKDNGILEKDVYDILQKKPDASFAYDPKMSLAEAKYVSEYIASKKQGTTLADDFTDWVQKSIGTDLATAENTSLLGPMEKGWDEGWSRTFKALSGLDNLLKTSFNMKSLGEPTGEKNMFDSFSEGLASEAEKVKYKDDPYYIKSTVKGITSFAPDLIAMYLMPEAELMQGIKIPKLAMYFGEKDFVTAYQESIEKDPTQKMAIVDATKGFLSGFENGMLLSALGYIGKSVGGKILRSTEGEWNKTLKDVDNTDIGGFEKENLKITLDIANKWNKTLADITAKSVGIGVEAGGFAGLTALQGGTQDDVISSAAMGFAMGLPGLFSKASYNFERSPKEFIKMVNKSDLKVWQLRLMELKLRTEAKKTTNLEVKNNLLTKAVALGNMADVKGFSSIADTKEFASFIESRPRIQPEMKNELIEKIKTIIESKDPRLEQIKPYEEQISTLQIDIDELKSSNYGKDFPEFVRDQVGRKEELQKMAREEIHKILEVDAPVKEYKDHEPAIQKLIEDAGVKSEPVKPVIPVDDFEVPEKPEPVKPKATDLSPEQKAIEVKRKEELDTLFDVRDKNEGLVWKNKFGLVTRGGSLKKAQDLINFKYDKQIKALETKPEIIIKEKAEPKTKPITATADETILKRKVQKIEPEITDVEKQKTEIESRRQDELDKGYKAFDLLPERVREKVAGFEDTIDYKSINDKYNKELSLLKDEPVIEPVISTKTKGLPDIGEKYSIATSDKIADIAKKEPIKATLISQVRADGGTATADGKVSNENYLVKLPNGYEVPISSIHNIAIDPETGHKIDIAGLVGKEVSVKRINPIQGQSNVIDDPVHGLMFQYPGKPDYLYPYELKVMSGNKEIGNLRYSEKFIETGTKGGKIGITPFKTTPIEKDELVVPAIEDTKEPVDDFEVKEKFSRAGDKFRQKAKEARAKADERGFTENLGSKLSDADILEFIANTLDAAEKLFKNIKEFVDKIMQEIRSSRKEPLSTFEEKIIRKQINEALIANKEEFKSNPVFKGLDTLFDMDFNEQQENDAVINVISSREAKDNVFQGRFTPLTSRMIDYGIEQPLTYLSDLFNNSKIDFSKHLTEETYPKLIEKLSASNDNDKHFSEILKDVKLTDFYSVLAHYKSKVRIDPSYIANGSIIVPNLKANRRSFQNILDNTLPNTKEGIKHLVEILTKYKDQRQKLSRTINGLTDEQLIQKIKEGTLRPQEMQRRDIEAMNYLTGLDWTPYLNQNAELGKGNNPTNWIWKNEGNEKVRVEFGSAEELLNFKGHLFREVTDQRPNGFLRESGNLGVYLFGNFEKSKMNKILSEGTKPDSKAVSIFTKYFTAPPSKNTQDSNIMKLVSESNKKNSERTESFNDVEYKRRDSYQTRNALVKQLEKLRGSVSHDPDNDLHKFYQKNKITPILKQHYGIANKTTNKKLSDGYIKYDDTMAIALKHYHAGSATSYDKLVGQNGEKKQQYSIPAPKHENPKKEYSLLYAKSKYKEFITTPDENNHVIDWTSDENDTKNDQQIKEQYYRINQYSHLFPSDGFLNPHKQKLAHDFYYDELINTYSSDLLFYGKPQNYGTFENRLKRLGSFVSSGFNGVTDIPGGLKKTQRIIVLNDLKKDIQVVDGKGKVLGSKKGYEITDGMNGGTQEYLNSYAKSFGTIFFPDGKATKIKDVVFDIDDQGNARLIKNMLVPWEVYKAMGSKLADHFIDISTKNDARIAFASTYKLNKEGVPVDAVDENWKPIKKDYSKHVIEIPTNSFYYQGTPEHEPENKKKPMLVQLQAMRQVSSEAANFIEDEMNKIAKRNMSKIAKLYGGLDSKQKSKLLLDLGDKLNPDIQNDLLQGFNADLPYIEKFFFKFITSEIEKMTLEEYSYGGYSTLINPMDIPLKHYEKNESGTMNPAESITSDLDARKPRVFITKEEAISFAKKQIDCLQLDNKTLLPGVIKSVNGGFEVRGEFKINMRVPGTSLSNVAITSVKDIFPEGSGDLTMLGPEAIHISGADVDDDHVYPYRLESHNGKVELWYDESKLSKEEKVKIIAEQQQTRAEKNGMLSVFGSDYRKVLRKNKKLIWAQIEKVKESIPILGSPNSLYEKYEEDVISSLKLNTELFKIWASTSEKELNNIKTLIQREEYSEIIHNSPAAVFNHGLRLLYMHFTNPENLALYNTPITADAYNKYIDDVRPAKIKDWNGFPAKKRAIQTVKTNAIGIAAKKTSLYDYLAGRIQLKEKIKKETISGQFTFPLIDTEGNNDGLKVIDKIERSPDNSEKDMLNKSSNLIVDDMKNPGAYDGGLGNATASVSFMLEEHNIDPKYIIAFMNSKAMKDFVGMLEESQKSINKNKSTYVIVKQLIKNYMPGMDDEAINKEILSSTKFPKIKNLDDYVGILQLYHKLDKLEKEESSIGSVIDYSKNPIQSDIELIQAQKNLNQLMSNDFTYTDATKIKNENFLEKGKAQIELLKNKVFNNSILFMKSTQEMISALEVQKAEASGQKGSSIPLSEDEYKALKKDIEVYLSLKAINIHKTSFDLTHSLQKFITDAIDNNRPWKQFCEILQVSRDSYTNQLEISARREVQGNDLPIEEMNVYYESFATMPIPDQKAFLALTIMQNGGIFKSSDGGNIFSFIDPKFIKEFSDDYSREKTNFRSYELGKGLLREIVSTDDELNFAKKEKTYGKVRNIDVAKIISKSGLTITDLAILANMPEGIVGADQVKLWKNAGNEKEVTRKLDALKVLRDELKIYEKKFGIEGLNYRSYSKILLDKLESGKVGKELSKTPEYDKLPSPSDKPTMTYAGIGSRETPLEILSQMKELARELETKGYTVNTGDAIGADNAFRSSVEKKNVFTSKGNATEQTRKIAKEIHPNPSAIDNMEKSDYVWGLHARNTNQIFGLDLKTPVDFVVVWTKDGGKTGGSGQAMRYAEGKGIPIINLYDTNWRTQLDKVLSEKPMITPQDFIKDMSPEFQEALAGPLENIMKPLVDEDIDLIVKEKEKNGEIKRRCTDVPKEKPQSDWTMDE